MNDVVNISKAVFTSYDPFPVPKLGWIDLGVDINFSNPNRWALEPLTTGLAHKYCLFLLHLIEQATYPLTRICVSAKSIPVVIWSSPCILLFLVCGWLPLFLNTLYKIFQHVSDVSISYWLAIFHTVRLYTESNENILLTFVIAHLFWQYAAIIVIRQCCTIKPCSVIGILLSFIRHLFLFYMSVWIFHLVFSYNFQSSLLLLDSAVAIAFPCSFYCSGVVNEIFCCFR